MYYKMEFHFISIIRGGYTTIIDPHGKTRVLCFSREHVARNCVRYISRYRSAYGIWPDMNLNEPTSRINPDINCKKRTPQEIGNYIEIEKKIKHDLDIMSTKSGVSYFYCHDFKYENDLLRIQMTGQEIDGEVSIPYFISRLDYRLKIV